VVFDLDDTLYLERDYQHSGFQSVINLLCSLYPVERQELENILEKGGDVLEGFAKEVGYPSIKESLLWHYRLHVPNISLSDDVKTLLNSLAFKGIRIVILTDGRSITQRQKLLALGLDKYLVYISDEYNRHIKPNPLRFKMIEKSIPRKKYIYIADNPLKDFLAPNQMGWLTIGLCSKREFINQYNLHDIPRVNLPKFWIKNIIEVIGFL
jgi:putative hydrolase of the HAD superfamily